MTDNEQPNPTELPADLPGPRPGLELAEPVELNPHREEVDLAVAKFKKDTERWERRLARQRKYSLWAMLPLSGCAVLFGSAVGRVLDSGSGKITAAMLIVGYIGLLATQWVVPELLRRREATEK
jgi:hypothetical protein